MSKLDFIYKRKSIRDYKDAVVPKEDILKMLDAATHAPSPKHQQNWHFVVVQDKEVINKMADAVSKSHEYIASLTKNEDESQEAWWVYIPRYEYKTETGGQIVDIKFIPKEQTDADPGYVIPDSFKFGDEENGYRQLAGYWISKYEVSE